MNQFLYYQSTASIASVEVIEFNAYPNPSSEIITISSEEMVKAIIVYSMDGKKLISQQANNVLNISSLPQGNYFIEVSTAKGSAQKMISKN